MEVNRCIVGTIGDMPRYPKDGGAVFVPRSLADNQRKFGRSSSRLIAGRLESPQQQAAELQHAIANRIRDHLLDQNTNLNEFCAAGLPVGLSYDRFQRILRGETMMTTTDMMFWASQVPDLAAFIGSTIGVLAADSREEPIPVGSLESDPGRERGIRPGLTAWT